MKRLGFQAALTALLVVVLSLPVLAKIYQIPADLKAEAKVLQAKTKADPTPENRFELAMNYGYTGRIEDGWFELRQVPKDYADDVVKKYEAVVQNDPQNWKALFKLAFGYYFIEKKDEAERCFLKVLDLQPNHVWAMGFIALLEGEKGKTDEAIKWCKKALAIEPNATAIHFLLGEGYRRKGNYWGMTSEIVTVGRLKAEEAVARRNEQN
ncbi:MAG: tetratricopeptide repeat protein [Candidatus Margulisiibacteriota bacterium]